MSTLRVTTLQNTSGVEVYTCKAWVNFNGTGTVVIRASGNVSSITDNGTGDYTVTFTTAMTDVNYAVAGTGKFTDNDGASTVFGMSISNRASNPSVGSVRIVTGQADNGTQQDFLVSTVAIFR
jgi:hypothetical protein